MNQPMKNRTPLIIVGAMLIAAVLTGAIIYQSQQVDLRVRTAEVEEQQARIDSLRSDNEALDAALAQSSQQVKDQAQQINQLEAETEALRQQLEAARQARSQIESNMNRELSQMTSHTAQLEQELAQRQTTQASLNASLREADDEKAELATRLQREHEAQQRLQQQIAAVNADIEDKSSALQDASLAALRLEYELARSAQEQRELQAQMDELARQREAEARQFAALEDRLNRELNESRVEISQLRDRTTVIKLTSEVLFSSGSALIKPEGQRVLEVIAETLREYPDRAIGIEGHTDNVPVGEKSRYPSNWELSTARAQAAVNFFQQKALVDPSRMKVVGHGEHHPISSNASPEGRQLNRRIEIRVWPSETS